MKDQLLFVDDDVNFVRRLSSRLTAFHVDTAAHLNECLSKQYKVALVDLDCSSGNAVDLIRVLRSNLENSCSILAYANRELGMDAILAYDAGADDCFCKNGELMMIEAKIRSAVARSARYTKRRDEQCNAADLLDDMDQHLTRFEQRLLRILATSLGQLVSKDVIVRAMWRRQCAESKLIYEHISTLRAKLRATDWTISNARGRGYRLERVLNHKVQCQLQPPECGE